MPRDSVQIEYLGRGLTDLAAPYFSDFMVPSASVSSICLVSETVIRVLYLDTLFWEGGLTQLLFVELLKKLRFRH